MRIKQLLFSILFLLTIEGAVADSGKSKMFTPVLEVTSSTDSFTRKTHHALHFYLVNKSKNSFLRLTLSCPDTASQYQAIYIYRLEEDKKTGLLKTRDMKITKVQSRTDNGNINQINAIQASNNFVLTDNWKYQNFINDVRNGNGIIRLNGSYEDTYKVSEPEFSDAYQELLKRCS